MKADNFKYFPEAMINGTDTGNFLFSGENLIRVDPYQILSRSWSSLPDKETIAVLFYTVSGTVKTVG